VIAELHAFERVREGATLATAEWEDRRDWIVPLVGQLVIPGLARRIFGCVPVGPEAALLRDALLQLAPGQIQILAAVTDRWFARQSVRDASGTAVSDPGPPSGSLGGMADSCWMWRRDGPLGRMRARSLAPEEADD
jgi:hypothetical protein